MKEIYTGKREVFVLKEDNYGGHHYAIVSYGTHPCVYIKIDKNHPMLDVQDMVDIPLEVHGGVTFLDELTQVPDLKETGFYIGWDYAHLGDYYDYHIGFCDGHKYTLQELTEHAYNVIDQIVDWEIDNKVENTITIKVNGNIHEYEKMKNALETIFSGNPNISFE